MHAARDLMSSLKFLPVLLVLILAHCLGQNLDGAASFHGTMSADHRRSYYDLDETFSVLLKGSSSESVVVSVEDLGAKGNGGDDSGAFQMAWKKACSSSTPVTVMVPGGKNYLLEPVTFSGPCSSPVTVMIRGTIEASTNLADWKGKDPKRWITFSEVDDLVVGGGGALNGNGKIWWDNSCKIKKSSSCMDTGPTALTFYSCKNLRVENLQLRDSQRMHVSFEKCSSVRASALSISAPERSPNTDGIHVTNTQAIVITNCVIQTGDDCISIESGSSNVVARNINCGPGHGISIGSLGENGSEAQVSGVTVDTAKLVGTTNGVRIKTMQGGKGYAKNITFSNIVMQNVQNPIIIDQNYCDSGVPCRKESSSAVAVSGVVYKNIKGTSSSQVAIDFECSKSVPCRGILLQDVNLALAGGGGGSAKATCENVQLSKGGAVAPLCANN